MSKEQERDKNLFQAITKGDQKAFKALFDQYYQQLLAIAINLLHDVNIAKDVIQNVFLQIWKKRSQITIPDKPEAYLKRSTINAALTYIRSRKRIVGMPQNYDKPSREPMASQIVEAKELEVVIQEAIADLPERCRMIFVMKRIEGRSLKEIASILDVSTKTVENQITKALKILKEVVKPYLKETQE